MIDTKQAQNKNENENETGSYNSKWPVSFQWSSIKWYPASTRLIGLVRTNGENFVLPPAVVRKAHWRD